MKYQKLFVHIGTQKTGSTALQHTLNEYSSELRKDGIIYLGKCREVASKHNIAKATEFDEELVNKLKTHIKNRIWATSFSKKNRFVISNEKFSGDKFTGYKNTSVLANLLFDATKDLKLDVNIIVFIRRQDDFFESTYAERVFRGATYSFREFLNRFDSSAFHWDDLIGAYANVFGEDKVHVERYGKQFLPHKDSLINKFGEIIQSDFLRTFDKTPLQNTGYRADTLEFARHNNQYLTVSEVKKMGRILKKMNSKSPHEKYSFFSDEERKEFLSNYNESNEKVARKYFKNTSPPLFTQPEPSDHHIVQNNLSAEEYNILMVKAMLAMYTEMERKLPKKPEKSSLIKETVNSVSDIYYRVRKLIYRI